MLPNVIELYPAELVQLVSESLDKWNQGLISRVQLNDEIVFLLMLFGRKQLRINERNLTILMKRDGVPLYDSDLISTDSMCPECALYFFEGSTTVYVHTGLRQHDKYVYACSCGSFFAMYCPKEKTD